MAETKKKNFKEKYYNLDEEDMQTYVVKAKSGDQQALEYVLEVFDNFIVKYVNLLFYGKYNLADYDVRRFIALYVSDNILRRNLTRNKLSKKGMNDVNDVLGGIRYMIHRYCDHEDVHQTVVMTFMQCLQRYTRKGSVPFSGYIYGYFFYMLKKNVDQLLIDQLGRKTHPLISDEESHEDWESDDKIQGFTAPPEPSTDELINTEEVDEHWVVGDTANPPFDELTIQERQLLRWRFVNGDKSSEIAERITEHPNTVREHFNRIRKKLSDNVASEID